LDFYTKYDSDIIISTREKMSNPLEAIIFYFKAYTEYYENYPAITAINQAYDVIACNDELKKKVKDIFVNRTSFTKELIDAAKEAGQICPDADSEQLADIIYGVNASICLKWRFNGYNFSLKEQTLSAVKTVLKAFGNK
jgi:hypothetical protein